MQVLGVKVSKKGVVTILIQFFLLLSEVDRGCHGAAVTVPMSGGVEEDVDFGG